MQPTKKAIYNNRDGKSKRTGDVFLDQDNLMKFYNNVRIHRTQIIIISSLDVMRNVSRW